MDQEPSDVQESDSGQDNSEQNPKNSRRNVLKAVGAAGALPISLTSDKEGSPTYINGSDTNDSLEQVYNSRPIEQIRRRFPQLDIDSKSVKAALKDANNNLMTVKITVPDGELTYINTAQSTEVILQLDSSVKYKFDDWPSYTDAWIRATANKAVFTRTATQFETILVSYYLGRTKMQNPTETEVAYSPEENKYRITKFNRNNKNIEAIVATTEGPSISDASGQNSLQIQSQNYYDESIGALTEEECEFSPATFKNIFFCLMQVTSCGLCASAFTFGGPPGGVACLLAVCFGTPTALEAALPQLENNCLDLVQRVVDCFDPIINKYY